MKDLKSKIVEILQELKGSGSFVSKGSHKLKHPGIVIEGLGELAFPINDLQAKALLTVAKKAPFGKGHETVYDDAVRCAWEIDARQISFIASSWEKQLARIVDDVKEELGLAGSSVQSFLYKLLIYKEGDFFLPHKDSEKEKGMFGSLIIGLPSRFQGGELVVSFGGETKVIDFAATAELDMLQYAAFYADCTHEVKPLKSGYRVCLVYNLVRKSGVKPAPQKTDQAARELTTLLDAEQLGGRSKPYVILLGHQYTPDNFSLDALKLNDRPKAEAILRAANKADHYAKLCLVTSYLAGMPAGVGGYYEFDDGGDEDAEMEEVYDDSLDIEHWAEQGVPGVNKVEFTAEDLIASIEINDGDPIEKEATGYMGNYGPDLMHWYHYGALLVWSHQMNAEFLARQDSNALFKWMDYFIQFPKMLSLEEKKAIYGQLEKGITDRKSKGIPEHYNGIVQWVIQQDDATFFNGLPPEILVQYFLNVETQSWISLMQFIGVERSGNLFATIVQALNQQVFAKYLTLLKEMNLAGLMPNLVSAQLDALPQYLTRVQSQLQKDKVPVNEATLKMIFWFSDNFKLSKNWSEQMLLRMDDFTIPKYRNAVVFPILMAEKSKSLIFKGLVERLISYLKNQQEPKAPVNWIRELPEGKVNKKVYKLLIDFFNSPDQQYFEYKALQANRREIEDSLYNAGLDIKWETIKKGSPQTLRITKTSRAYQDSHKQWELDRAQLSELETL